MGVYFKFILKSEWVRKEPSLRAGFIVHGREKKFQGAWGEGPEKHWKNIGDHRPRRQALPASHFFSPSGASLWTGPVDILHHIHTPVPLIRETCCIWDWLNRFSPCMCKNTKLMCQVLKSSESDYGRQGRGDLNQDGPGNSCFWSQWFGWDLDVSRGNLCTSNTCLQSFQDH